MATPSTRHNISETGIDVNTEGITISDGNARWPGERIDRLIREFSASNQDYSQAHAMLMNPRDYLKLTLYCTAFSAYSIAQFVQPFLRIGRR